jgi:hypothetical protein
MYVRLFVAAIASMFVYGCASYKVTTAPALDYDFQARSGMVEKQGVILMAKPIHDPVSLEQYFDDDPLKYGILPLQLHVENKAHEHAVICPAKGINLIDSSNTEVLALSLEQVMDKVQKSYWRTAGWTVGFGIFGLIPSAINVGNTNKKMRADYETKMFKGGEIDKGSATEGFLFYLVPEDIRSLDGWKLAAVLKSAEKSTDIVLTQQLSGTIAPRPKENETQSTYPAED